MNPSHVSLSPDLQEDRGQSCWETQREQARDSGIGGRHGAWVSECGHLITFFWSGSFPQQVRGICHYCQPGELLTGNDSRRIFFFKKKELDNLTDGFHTQQEFNHTSRERKQHTKGHSQSIQCVPATERSVARWGDERRTRLSVIHGMAVFRRTDTRGVVIV